MTAAQVVRSSRQRRQRGRAETGAEIAPASTTARVFLQERILRRRRRNASALQCVRFDVVRENKFPHQFPRSIKTQGLPLGDNATDGRSEPAPRKKHHKV